MTKDIIIFDLDGTLLNTLDDLHKSFNYALKCFGYKQRTLEEIRNFVGNGIMNAMQRALPHFVSDKEFNDIMLVFENYYQNHMGDVTKPYDGILPMLRELKQKGYKTAVVSNKFDSAVKGLCENYFGNLIQYAIGESFDIRKKPESDGILKVIKELNSSLETAIYAGDSDVDILTAKKVKIPCISVLWGYRNKEFLRQNGAKIFAEKPEDILKIIEKKLYLL